MLSLFMPPQSLAGRGVGRQALVRGSMCAMDMDEVIETEVAMSISASAHALVGGPVTVLTEDGVVTGTLTDYDVSPARLEDGVVHVDLGLLVQPDPGFIDITIVLVNG